MFYLFSFCFKLIMEEYITNFTLSTGISKHTLTFKSINQVKAGSAIMTRSSCTFINIFGKNPIIITLLIVEFKTCISKTMKIKTCFFGYNWFWILQKNKLNHIHNIFLFTDINECTSGPCHNGGTWLTDLNVNVCLDIPVLNVK